MLVTILTSATGEPVTVEEAKQHLRVETTAEDDLIDSYIHVARKVVENKIRRTLLPIKYKLILGNFPGATNIIELPQSPLLSSTGSTLTGSTSVCVTFYKDTTIVNDSTTVSATVYAVDSETEHGRIYPIYDNEWPSCVTEYKKDAVQITYWSGYVSRDKVPEPIKTWIKMKVASLYEAREPFVDVRTNEVQYLRHEYFDGLLDGYVVFDR